MEIPPPSPCKPWHDRTILHVLLLIAVSSYYVVVSWRRWPDPIVDFGRELYLPWRLASGAVLYRDADHFYGPFSQYINSLLFRLFDPGLMVLVFSNFIIFAGITGLIYYLFRKAWSARAALAGSVVFVAVFGFSRYTFAGNFNFATPYAHETTHGLLAVLVLIVVADCWLERPSSRLSFLAGVLFGLTLLLKPEIAFAAFVSLAATAAMHVLNREEWRAKWLAWAIAGAVLPTLLFASLFLSAFSPQEALAAACRGWLNVVVTRSHVFNLVQAKYSGFDAAGRHAREHALAAAQAIAALASLAGAGFAVSRTRGNAARWALGSLVVAAVLACASLSPSARWIEVGRCLPGLLLACAIFLVLKVWRSRGAPLSSALRIQVLLTAVAGALICRMALNGRIYHYGYYQASLALIVITAVMLHELPQLPRLGGAGRGVVIAGVLALILPGVVILSTISRRNYQLVNVPLGQGRDMFYVIPQAESVARLVSYLEKSAPHEQSLVVIPEGLMVNYLARMRSSVPAFFFHSAGTADGNEAKIVADLDAHSPDWIVTLPIDLTEYGIQHYGERSGSGGDIVAWARSNYQTAYPPYTPFFYSNDVVHLFQKKTVRQ